MVPPGREDPLPAGQPQSPELGGRSVSPPPPVSRVRSTSLGPFEGRARHAAAAGLEVGSPRRRGEEAPRLPRHGLFGRAPGPGRCLSVMLYREPVSGGTVSSTSRAQLHSAGRCTVLPGSPASNATRAHSTYRFRCRPRRATRTPNRPPLAGRAGPKRRKAACGPAAPASPALLQRGLARSRAPAQARGTCGSAGWTLGT